ncbi:MAG TPA: response regulator transcription factor [Terriglobales bacterium]
MVSVFRVLIVDDFEPWRRLVRSMLQHFPEWQIVGEASDGVEAVQKTEELQPDLVLLDIGLPKLNGIDVAKPILSVAPHSKIIFVSVEFCPELVEGALRTGGHGYVVKSDAASDLLTAMSTVMNGQRFVGSRFANYDFILPDLNRP